MQDFDNYMPPGAHSSQNKKWFNFLEAYAPKHGNWRVNPREWPENYGCPSAAERSDGEAWPRVSGNHPFSYGYNVWPFSPLTTDNKTINTRPCYDRNISNPSAITVAGATWFVIEPGHTDPVKSSIVNWHNGQKSMNYLRYDGGCGSGDATVMRLKGDGVAFKTYWTVNGKHVF